MCEPSVPEPASLEDVSQRRTAWARGVPVALTVVIFLLIFWRIPFGAFWNAMPGRNCCLSWRSWGRFLCVSFCSTPSC